MRKIGLLCSLLYGSIAIAQRPVDYVNPFIGASSSVEEAGTYHGLGKTFPGATTPFGMVQISPNTITGGDNGSGYSYEHTSMEGFAFTQMSGVGWYGDLGNFLVMPTTGNLNTFSGTLDHPDKGYRSVYDKKSETASPGYYAVFLEKYKVKAEMAAAPHSGILRFSFPQNNQSRIQIDLARRVGGTSTLQYVRVVDANTIEGYMKCEPSGGGWGDGDGKADYTVYFYAKFSKPLSDYGFWAANIPDNWKRKREDVTSSIYRDSIAHASIIKGKRELTGKHIGFFSQFATAENENVLLKVGISFVSMDGARKNLNTEIHDWDFDKVKDNATRLWNNALGKVKIEGGDKDQKTTFYTALYHTMIDPRIFADVGGSYMDGDRLPHKQNGFTKRTIFSGWDVFRSQMPLQTIINPSVVNDMVNSLIFLADRSKKQYYSRWELLNAYSECMIGNPAVAVLADAYVKGIRSYDLTKAYNYAANTVEWFGNGTKGYSSSGNSISETLENAYSYWCMSVLAKELGTSKDMSHYKDRSLDYKNVFDSSHHWFRPKDENGNWLPWPEEGRLKQWYGTIESNPYQQGWFVPHDIDGMVDLMGGRELVVADLERMFEYTPKNYLWNDYYNHANEPVHHVPFLFNRIGYPWLTQKWTRDICSGAYHNAVKGLIGNEDVGQMSAWYVLAASGLHPICPGDPRYEITSPVFDKIVFRLDKKYATGNSFTIIAHNNNVQNIYIQYAKLNGQAYNKCYVNHNTIAEGGVLELYMGSKPNKEWGLD